MSISNVGFSMNTESKVLWAWLVSIRIALVKGLSLFQSCSRPISLWSNSFSHHSVTQTGIYYRCQMSISNVGFSMNTGSKVLWAWLVSIRVSLLKGLSLFQSCSGSYSFWSPTLRQQCNIYWDLLGVTCQFQMLVAPWILGVKSLGHDW